MGSLYTLLPKGFGEDEILFCAGLCNGAIHRYCAGISTVHFESMKAAFQAAAPDSIICQPETTQHSQYRVPFLCLVYS